MNTQLFLCLTFAGLVACGSSSSTDVGSGSPPAPASVGPHANGTLADWQSLGEMPTPRGNLCAVAANNWLVVIGGNYKPKGKSDFVTTAEIHAARLNPDGTVGAWQLAGKTPSPVSSCTAAADGKTVILLDGIYDDDTAARQIHATTIGDDGMLAPWRDIGALPDGARVLYSQASLTKNVLRAFDAKLPDSGDAVVVLTTKLGADGNVTTWDETVSFAGFRGHPQYAFADAYVYALGGYASSSKDNAVLTDGAGASITGAGSTFNVAALPKATAFGQAVAVDDYVFVVGGKDEVMSGKGRADAFAAKIGDAGGLAEWATAASLPQGRTAHALVAAGNYLYVVGGGYDGGGLASVFSAQVRFE